MSDTPEGRVKKRVKKLLAEHGCFWTCPVPSGYGESTLDFVGHHRGAYFEIEAKAPGKHPTPRQQHRIDLIRTSGGIVFIVGESVENDPDTWYSGMTELEEWLKRS